MIGAPTDVTSPSVLPASADDERVRSRQWFAVRTRARHEKKVRDRLASRGVDLLLPLIWQRQRWSDRIQRVELPLFSCYCFVRIGHDERRIVMEAPGVVGLVCHGERPAPIPDREIEALKRVSSSRLPFEAHPYLDRGAMVEIVRGPLTGVRGRLVQRDSRAQLVLAVDLIQQAAAVHIDEADVRPVHEPYRSTTVSTQRT